MTPLIINLFSLMPGKEAVSLIMPIPSNEGSGIVVYTQRQSLDTENAKPVLYRKKVILARRGEMRSPWKLERRGWVSKELKLKSQNEKSLSSYGPCGLSILLSTLASGAAVVNEKLP